MASSAHQVQSVAKRLEKMLETALNQLKIEQKMRRECENKLVNIELDLVNKEHQIKSLEEEIVNTKAEKDDKINNLESTINFLQSVVIQKEKEVLAIKEELSRSNAGDEDIENTNLGRNVEKYEETLNQLVGNHHEDYTDEDTFSGNGAVNIKDEYNDVEEEYILDESMEELSEDVSVSEEARSSIAEFKENYTIKSRIKSKAKCNICKEVFKNKGDLQRHQKENGHLVLFDCDMCDKKFKTKSIAQMHKLRIHSTVMPFKCGKCEKRFKDQGSCRRHEANDSVHIRLENMKLNPNLICNVCGKEFDRSRRWCLDQHLLTHLANKKFPCDFCGQFYRQKGYLLTHMKVCRDRQIKSCGDCGEKFKTEEELSEHESGCHVADAEGPYSCTICSLNFSSYRGYMLHGDNVHNATSAEHFASIQEIISNNS